MIQIVHCSAAVRSLLFAGGQFPGLYAWPAHATTYTVGGTTDAPAAASAIAAGICADAASADVTSGKTDPDTANNRAASSVSAVANGGGATDGAALGALLVMLLVGVLSRRRRMKQRGHR